MNFKAPLSYLVILFCSFKLHAQNEIAPAVTIRYENTARWDQRMNQFGIGGCVAFNRRFFLGVLVGHESVIIDYPNIPANIGYFTGAFEAKFRVLPQEKRLSPLIQLTLGKGTPYKGDRVYMTTFTTSESKTPDALWTLGQVTNFGSLELAVDAKWKQFHFQLGIGGNFVNLHFDRVNPNYAATTDFTLYHWMASCSITYVLNFHKKPS